MACQDEYKQLSVINFYIILDTDLRISKMELRAQTTVYENGSVSWRICAGDNCFVQTGKWILIFL